MRVEWDRAKDRANQRKHGLSYSEAATLFQSGVEYFEIYDEAHSIEEDRFIAIGPIRRGLIVVVWTEPMEGRLRMISARFATKHETDLYRRSAR